MLDDHFVRPDGVHAIVDTVATAPGLALDPVKRRGMNHGSGRPAHAGSVWRCGDYLPGGFGIGAETTGCFWTAGSFAGFIADDDPGAGDGILTEFHMEGEHRREMASTGLLRMSWAWWRTLARAKGRLRTRSFASHGKRLRSI